MSQGKLVIPYRKNERKRFSAPENHRKKRNKWVERERAFIMKILIIVSLCIIEQ